MLLFRFSAVVCLTLCFYTSVEAAEFDVPQHYRKMEFRIPMRDGRHLFTAVYVPKDTTANYPILLTRTPYGVDPYGADKYPKQLGPSSKFDEDGFVFVFQDVRGRYMSEGAWIEMTPQQERHTGLADLPAEVNESTDAYDTIDWLIKNVPGNNGKVGLLGVSYPGFYASADMIDAHPALVAASPQAPVSDLYRSDDAYHNGAFFLLANFSFYIGFPRQHNPVASSQDKPFSYGTKDGYRFYLRAGADANLNRYFKEPNPYWADVIAHPDYDDFWKVRDILPHLRRIKPAVLVVGGWFDAEDLSGTLKTYRAIRSQSPDTKVNLVMGPWAHGGWEGKGGSELGDISFGSNTSEFFQDRILLPFFRSHLKNAPDPDLPPAYVFKTGENTWNRETSWPPSNVGRERLYLREKGTLSGETPAGSTGFDEYVSDPAHPVPFFSGHTIEMDRKYMDADQRFVSGRHDVLTYRSAVLTQDVTVAGPISPSLFVSTSGTDSDFIVKLIDCYPGSESETLSGYQQLVRGEPFRGKFRNNFETPVAFKPGEIQHIAFTMPDVYHCFRREHRIMVQIQSSWFPLIDRNPQTFTNIPFAQPSEFQKARQRIYRAQNAASFVELNILQQLTPEARNPPSTAIH